MFSGIRKNEKKSEGIPFGNLREIEETSKGSSFGEYGVASRALPENPLIHIFVLSLCSCVVLVKMCYARELFDNAAFGRVIFNRIFLLSLCSCVVLVKVCYACELFDNAAFGRVIF